MPLCAGKCGLIEAALPQLHTAFRDSGPHYIAVRQSPFPTPREFHLAIWQLKCIRLQLFDPGAERGYSRKGQMSADDTDVHMIAGPKETLYGLAERRVTRDYREVDDLPRHMDVMFHVRELPRLEIMPWLSATGPGT